MSLCKRYSKERKNVYVHDQVIVEGKRSAVHSLTIVWYSLLVVSMIYDDWYFSFRACVGYANVQCNHVCVCMRNLCVRI